MKKILPILVLVLAVLACDKDEKNKGILQTKLNEGIDPLLLLDDFPIDSFYGKSYEGGLIFHIMSNGTGMVAALEDISTSAVWGCGGQQIDGADDKFIGFGKKNTDSITSQCLDIYSAAWRCENYQANGYSDWYLPSFEELRKMRATLYKAGYGDFSPYQYWSSTEGSPANTAYYVLFDDGTYDTEIKSLNYHVRGIRNF